MSSIQLRLSEIQGDKSDGEFEKLLGVGKGTISSIYKGGKPSSIVLIPLAEKLNVNLNWLLVNKGTRYFNYDIEPDNSDHVSDSLHVYGLNLDEAAEKYKSDILKITENAIKKIEDIQKASKKKK